MLYVVRIWIDIITKSYFFCGGCSNDTVTPASCMSDRFLGGRKHLISGVWLLLLCATGVGSLRTGIEHAEQIPLGLPTSLLANAWQGLHGGCCHRRGGDVKRVSRQRSKLARSMSICASTSAFESCRIFVYHDWASQPRGTWKSGLGWARVSPFTSAWFFGVFGFFNIDLIECAWKSCVHTACAILTTRSHLAQCGWNIRQAPVEVITGKCCVCRDGVEATSASIPDVGVVWGVSLALARAFRTTIKRFLHPHNSKRKYDRTGERRASRIRQWNVFSAFFCGFGYYAVAYRVSRVDEVGMEEESCPSHYQYRCCLFLWEKTKSDKTHVLQCKLLAHSHPYPTSNTRVHATKWTRLELTTLTRDKMASQAISQVR